MELMVLAGFATFGLFLLGFGLFYTVDQNQQAVVERFGKYVRTTRPGLNVKIPLIEHVIKRDMRILSLDLVVETKTEDNVFVALKVSTQYQISDIVKAVYKLQDVKAQLTSYVYDAVRAKVPSLKLDEVFEKKDDIADSVKKELTEAMTEFGFAIIRTLVTDIDPAADVKAAMNSINAAQRERMAATEKGEANKILQIKQAEAEAMSKKLQGEGIANQRSAIINGLKDSIAEMKEVTGKGSEEVMALILTTQYFDTLKSIGEKGHATTIMLPHQPGGVTDIQQQIMNGLLAAKSHDTEKKPSLN